MTAVRSPVGEDKMRADMHACACMGVVDDWNDNESVRVRGGFP